MKKYLVPVVGSNLAGVMEFTIEAASEEEAKDKVAGVREGKIDPKDIFGLMPCRMLCNDEL